MRAKVLIGLSVVAVAAILLTVVAVAGGRPHCRRSRRASCSPR